MVKGKLVIFVILILVVPVLVFALMPLPPSVSANPGSQTWYLTDTSDGAPTGADYFMYRGSGNGAADALLNEAKASKIWAADEASNIVIDMSGEWLVTLRARKTAGPPCGATVDIGILSGGSFLSKGSCAQDLIETMTSYNLTASTTDHNLAPGDYLAIKIYTNKDAEFDVHGDVDSPCYIISPSTAPNYPGVEYISFSVTDNGDPGILFGSLNPGTTDSAEAAQNGIGAVTLTVGSETNVNCNIKTKATNFSTNGYTIAITNAKWDTDNNVDGATTMTMEYVIIDSSTAYTEKVVDVWHWLSIPGGQPPGTYTSTFYYQAIKSGG